MVSLSRGSLFSEETQNWRHGRSIVFAQSQHDALVIHLGYDDETFTQSEGLQTLIGEP